MSDNQNEQLPGESEKPSMHEGENYEDAAPAAYATPTQQLLPTTENKPQTTEAMEVHHHGHVHEKKKWKEYLFQFFMLFLAVFCGFLAEYKLEQTIEKHREHQFIESTVNDMKMDTAKIAKIVKWFDGLMGMADTLQWALQDDVHAADFYFKPSIRSKISWLKNGFPDFIYTDGTIQQLKNSGGFRLLQKRQVVDSIMDYDSKVQAALINQQGLTGSLLELTNAIYAFYDYRIIEGMSRKAKQMNIQVDTNYVFTHNADEVKRFYAKLKDYKDMLRAVKSNLELSIRPKAINTIAFLTKEYDLK